MHESETQVNSIKVIIKYLRMGRKWGNLIIQLWRDPVTENN